MLVTSVKTRNSKKRQEAIEMLAKHPAYNQSVSTEKIKGSSSKMKIKPKLRERVEKQSNDSSHKVSLIEHSAVTAESPIKAIETIAALELQLKDLKERFESLYQVLEQFNSIKYLFNTPDTPKIEHLRSVGNLIQHVAFEVHDRIKRSKNVIAFNLPEKLSLESISSAVANDCHIERRQFSCVRLRKKSPKQVCPVLFKFSNDTLAEKFICSRSALSLRKDYVSMVLKPDLTVLQRECKKAYFRQTVCDQYVPPPTETQELPHLVDLDDTLIINESALRLKSNSNCHKNIASDSIQCHISPALPRNSSPNIQESSIAQTTISTHSLSFTNQVHRRSGTKLKTSSPKSCEPLKLRNSLVAKNTGSKTSRGIYTGAPKHNKNTAILNVPPNAVTTENQQTIGISPTMQHLNMRPVRSITCEPLARELQVAERNWPNQNPLKLPQHVNNLNWHVGYVQQPENCNLPVGRHFPSISPFQPFLGVQWRSTRHTPK
ncbi:unnamed protein product [Dicrocoelium dendriticum]|nr:unnamed protein product [Dicrocoelium dendriticum]